MSTSDPLTGTSRSQDQVNWPDPVSNIRTGPDNLVNYHKLANIQSKTYLEKRRKNNEAAKRSREKRRKQELHLEQRVMELKEENDNFIRQDKFFFNLTKVSKKN